MKAKARFLAAALALGLVAAGTGARNYVGADHLVHFPRSRVRAEDTARFAAELPGLEPVTLRTSDGLSLRGWFWKPASGSRGMVVLVHGGGASRLQLLPEACALARHGFGFLAYDSRASGDSDGDTVTWGDTERRDLSAAVDFLVSRPGVDRARIAVLGLSIGGSTVALEAADDPRPSAVILYATWTSL
jgi:dipeptidyl aminopeptidase/acylaminoacyl peptidase